jgi:hypothetical protein
MLIREWGYVLVVAAGIAVCLFCWLSYASLSRPPRNK